MPSRRRNISTARADAHRLREHLEKLGFVQVPSPVALRAAGLARTEPTGTNNLGLTYKQSWAPKWAVEMLKAAGGWDHTDRVRMLVAAKYSNLRRDAIMAALVINASDAVVLILADHAEWIEGLT